VKQIIDELDHVKLHARKVQDRALLAEACVFQVRAERRLGVLLSRAKEEGHLREGRPVKAVDGAPVTATLAEIGVDKKLSMRAQQAARLDDDAFTALEEDTRERIRAGKALVVEAVTGSRAIMNSRHEPDDSLDYFPTPPWATRALFEHVFAHLGCKQHCQRQTAWEPAWGEGQIGEVLCEYFKAVFATDIHDYGYGHF